jgi:translation initiation factor 3 subunit I
VAKDKTICAWFTSNGERLGTYQGHQGAIWTVDISPNTKILASGAADNTVKLWNIKTGECVKTWELPTAIKRVEFSEDGTQLLAVTEKRMGFLGTIVVYDIRYEDDLTDQTDEHSLRIQCERSKATVAAWSFLDKYIISGHEDGTVSQFDGKVELYFSHHCLRSPLTRFRRPVNSCLTPISTTTELRSTTFKCQQIERISSLQGKINKPR